MMDLHIKKTMFQVINNVNIDVAPNGSSSFLAQSSILSSILGTLSLSSLWSISSILGISSLSKLFKYIKYLKPLKHYKYLRHLKSLKKIKTKLKSTRSSHKIKSQDTRSQDTRSQEHKIESDCSTISSLLRYGSNTSNSLPYSTA